MKKYRKTGAALLAAALLCTGGAAQAAELTVTSPEDLSMENGWTQHNGSIWAPTQDISGNVVSIGSGGTSPELSNAYISGGYSDKDVVSANSVTMESGTVCNVYGGFSEEGSASAERNTVTVSGGEVKYLMYGGYSREGNAESNTVTISDGKVGQDVNGGFSSGGSAENNTVTISGGNVEGTVFGGNSGTGSAERNTVTVSGKAEVRDVFGGFSSGGSAESNTVTISGKAEVCDVYGGYTLSNRKASNNTVTISGEAVVRDVYGGCSRYSSSGSAERNTVTISGGDVEGTVYGGYSAGRSASDNTVTLTGDADVSGAQLYGSNVSIENSGNKLVVDNWTSRNEKGNVVGGLHNFESIEFQNVKLSEDGTAASSLEVAETGTIENISGVKITSLAAGDYAADPDKTLTATVKWDSDIQDAEADVKAVEEQKWFTADREEGGLYANQYNTTVTQSTEEGKRKVTLNSTVIASAVTGKFIDSAGQAVDASRPLVIGDGFTTNVDTIAGAYAQSDQDAAGGQVYITGTPAEGFTKTVYAGYSENGAVTDNTVYVGWDGSTMKAAQASGLSVYGSNKKDGTDNTLHVYGNGNTLGSIGQFNTVAFDDVTLNDAVALSVTDADLTGASVSLNSLKGGTVYNAGDHVTLLQSTNDMTGADSASVTYSGNVTAGVAQNLQIETEKTATSIGMTVKSVSLAPQTLTIAENRTAAAAFLNQGADIAADSLDLLSSDYKYGLRTFGAVYGSRSTYDAAGDLKINGWSEIVGLGNVHRKGDGDLSWGVFYENGTGNYRTWNEFNNEMFRGDGSLLYNGGGAALRYQKDNGWYYEASLRAGTLSASMDNAVKDGKGNSYGFDSDSTYWGAHAGVGKVIETEQGEWNVYGKYFHTDIDGDSFTIAGDAFTFDSLTSDRLRLGARYTTDKAKRWSLYYGLAWEYEFTGDSHMKAAGMNAPEQSLGGSTGIAEIGTVWQPDDSPWQANINLKGYAGEREGVSGMVQLAYTF